MSAFIHFTTTLTHADANRNNYCCEPAHRVAACAALDGVGCINPPQALYEFHFRPRGSNGTVAVRLIAMGSVRSGYPVEGAAALGFRAGILRSSSA